MRSTKILFGLLCAAAACVAGAAVASQSGGQSVPADCRKKQKVQVLSSGSLVIGDTSKVNCDVTYWICDVPTTKSKVVDNRSGECDKFKQSVMAEVPAEVCCDCYPNCGAAQPATQPATQPASVGAQNCCDQVRQLQDKVAQLEERLKRLEDKLSGDDITLGQPGGSSIRITQKSDAKTGATAGIVITSDHDITVKSSSNVVIKGAHVKQN